MARSFFSKMKVFSRRAQRKQDRVEKKQKKNKFHQRKGQAAETSNDDAKSIAENSVSDVQVAKTKKKRKRIKPKKTRFEIEREKRFIRDEEKAIKKYEKLLKLKTYTKRNRLPKSFYLDGLGELIEICDRKQYDNRIAAPDDNEEYLKEKRTANNPDLLDNDVDDDAFNEESVHESGSDDNDGEEANDSSGEYDDIDEEGEINSADNDFSSEEDANLINVTTNNKSKKLNQMGHYEDIYGFTRDSDGNIVKTESCLEAKQRVLSSNVTVDETLQRKLRGLLNRLTADNIKVIGREVADQYKNNSRAVVNQGIWNCLEKTMINVEHHVPSKLVSELSLLIAILHTEIGEEIGAFFVHSLIRRFDELFDEPSSWTDSKKLNNVLIFLLNVHATGLLDSTILFDLLDKFCDRLPEEKAIELIDLTLKSSGFRLRRDDAAKMKSFILNIQQSASTIDVSGLSGTRIKFILESLTAIKNNNVAKLKVSEPVVMSELIESTLKAVIKKARVAAIPGQFAAVIQSAHWFSFTKTIVPLEAINAKKGGSKKSSNDHSDERNDDRNEDDEDTAYQSTDTMIDTRLRDQLCRTLRINTPLRKSLFTAMLRCTDYVDAASKLITIGKKQFSEVINVVLHVALKEKTYNPFYYHLLQHLTTCDRKYKLALDFATRDKIAQLETLSISSRSNFVKLTFNLLIGGALSITCLKVVEFSDMNEIYVDFIRKILEPLLSECDDETVESVLSKIPKKDNFASAIKLFITCFMTADSKNRLSSVKQLQFKLKI